MIKKLARWILKKEIDSKDKSINVYFDTVNRLENENKCIKDLRLKLKIAEQYINDDEALLELFNESKKEDFDLGQAALRQQAAMMSGQQRLFGQGQDTLAAQFDPSRGGGWI